MIQLTNDFLVKNVFCKKCGENLSFSTDRSNYTHDPVFYCINNFCDSFDDLIFIKRANIVNVTMMEIIK